MSLIKIKQIEGLQAKLDLLDSQLASGSLKSSYTQAGHGFAAGEVIAYFNGTWVLADASTADKLGRLVVESVDGDSFIAVQIGTIEVSSWNLTPGTFYVVDESGLGQIAEYVNHEDPAFAFSNPVLQALTSTVAHVLPWRPNLAAASLPQGQEYSQINLTPTASNGDYSPTGITLDYTPFTDSSVQVYINGVAVTETYGTRDGDVYFSADGGATAKQVADLASGDELYWNGGVAGYEIGSEDSFDLVYEKNNQD